MITRSNIVIQNQETSDSIKIKNEYSNYNNEYYNVILSDHNVYKLISENELKDILNKKDGLIFFGNSKNNISRKAILELNEVISSTSIPQVYYLDINSISSDLKNELFNKLNINNILGGTLISIQGGEVLNVFYPKNINDDKELTDQEKQFLQDNYKSISEAFVEACDENC